MNQNESPRPKAPVSEDAELVRLIGIIKDWRFADRHGGTEDANNRILAERIILSRSPIELDSLGTERASEVVRLDGPDEEVVRWRDLSRAPRAESDDGGLLRDAIGAADTYRKRAEAAEAERDRLREFLRWADGRLVPELSPSNYDHEQVCELNANVTEVVLAIRALLLAAKGENDGQN